MSLSILLFPFVGFPWVLFGGGDENVSFFFKLHLGGAFKVPGVEGDGPLHGGSSGRFDVEVHLHDTLAESKVFFVSL